LLFSLQEIAMQAYRIRPGAGIEGLERVDQPTGEPGAREVLVRVRAVSLNYRDLTVAGGKYPGTPEGGLIPCSDGAGEVVAVGPGVTRFGTGDRVMAAFFPHWIDGEMSAPRLAGALGGGADGMLAEEVLLPEEALVAVPAHLDFTEAATLPCAGVTAWHALFHTGNARPGDTVLLLGTGGVSIWGLQLAKAAGLNAVITSSSDGKLQRARDLGADATVNYRTSPEWQDEVLRATDGRGADVVVEVGGEETLPRSLAAAAMNGTVVVIGGVSGFGAAPIEPRALLAGAKRLAGVFVGSRKMLEDTGRFTKTAGIRPVVDRVFPFDEAKDAYRYLESGKHFGKVAIAVGA